MILFVLNLLKKWVLDLGLFIFNKVRKCERFDVNGDNRIDI